MVVQGQVEDLRERLQLLQKDRRANVDLLETTKLNNAEEIKNLREENKELRSKLTRLHKSFTSSKQQGKNELSTLRKEVLGRRAEYDSLRVTSGKRKRELSKLRDEAKACELEATQPNQDDTPLARQIRLLENRLDKAMIKYNEAQSIRSTYEHIVKRLKEERIGFDNQLTALERTVQAKQRDYEELLLLSGDASHARDVAQQQLHVARCDYEEKRIGREGELRERHQTIKVRKQMIERQKRKEEKNWHQEQAAAGTVDEAGGGAPNTSATGNGGSTGRRASVASTSGIDQVQKEEEEEDKIDMYERAFRKIREATGVSDVNEVIKKIIGQESTTDNLIALTKQNQQRIEELVRQRDELRKNAEDLEYNNGSGSPHGRKAADEKEKRLNESIKTLSRNSSKHDRYMSNLFNMKAGVKHLQDKLEPVRRDLNAGKVGLSDSSLPDALWGVGDILVEILARIREREITGEVDGTLHVAAATAGGANDADVLSTDYINGNDERDEAEDGNKEETLLHENRPYNQRIVLPSAKDDLYETSESFDDGYGDLDEEPSRERVKKTSMSIVLAQQRKKARERRRS